MKRIFTRLGGYYAKGRLLTAALLLAGSLSYQASATVCTDATPISTTLPATGSVVCGTSDDITGSNSPNGSFTSNYKTGQEALYTFAPTLTGSYKIDLSAVSTWTSIWVFDGCPTTTGTTLVSAVTGTSASKTLSLDLTAGTTYYVMFDTWSTPISVCSGGPATYTITLLSSCVAPTTISAVPTSSSTATVSWTAPSPAPSGGYDYYLSTSATAPADTTAPTGNVAASPLSLSGLSSDSTYRVYVRSNCGGEASLWKPGGSFTTLQPIPYSQGFATTTLPLGWSNSGFSIGSVRGATGNPAKCIYKNIYGTSSTGSFTTGTMGLTAATTALSFEYKTSNYSSPYDAPGADAGAIIISASTDGGSTYTQLDSFGVGTDNAYNTQVTALTGIPAGSAIKLKFAVRRFSGDFDISFDNIFVGNPPTCTNPGSLAASGVTTDHATLSWAPPTSGVPSGGYDFYLSTDATPPTAATVPSGHLTDTFITFDTLTSSTPYYFHVRSICSATDTSSWTSTSFNTLLSNDLPSSAIALTVGAGCPATLYTNVGGSHSTGEPYATCGSSGNSTVWFKFTAPASGMIKLSTNHSGGSLNDTRIALYEATDSSDFSSFSIINCNEDLSGTYLSTVYGIGLTPAQTYYVVVDKYSSFTTPGTFCLTADDVDSSNLSTVTSCGTLPAAYSSTGYAGFTQLGYASGNLGILAKSNATAGYSTSKFQGAQNIATGVRSSGGESYIQHNWHLRFTSPTAADTSFDIIFSFPTAELDAISATIADVNVTQLSGSTCAEDISPADAGLGQLLTPLASGSANGVSWIKVHVNGFSNFFVHTGTVPLAIDLEDITAQNDGPANNVAWKSATETYGYSYELERSSDGRTYDRIASIAGHGMPSAYKYRDEQALQGLNYYRLRIMNGNSLVGYSKVVTAEVKDRGAFALSAYPNPAHQELNVRIGGSISGNASITITDVLGKTVRVLHHVGSSLRIDMGNLPAGTYFLKYQDDARSQSIKVNKD